MPACKLLLRFGPHGVGEQFFLIGDYPIEIGKLPDKPIHLIGDLVSRGHCRMVPAGPGWRVEDQQSTNGLFVNGDRISHHQMADGDVLRVGEYELRYYAGDGRSKMISLTSEGGAISPPPSRR